MTKLDLGQLPKQGKGYFFINPDIVSIERCCGESPSYVYADNHSYFCELAESYEDVTLRIGGRHSTLLKFDFANVEPDKDDVIDARAVASLYFGAPMPLESMRFLNRIGLEKIVVNGPATIAFWSDGTKTIIKLREGDAFDLEKAIALLYLKKLGEESGFKLHRILKDAEKKTADHTPKPIAE